MGMYVCIQMIISKLYNRVEAGIKIQDKKIMILRYVDDLALLV